MSLARAFHLFVTVFAIIPCVADERPFNTQAETTPLLSPEAARQSFRVPTGFDVTLVAAEPMVRQPVAMAFDPRGRLWIAENYTYAEQTLNFDLERHDRVVILSDVDGDGVADEQRVFWDQAQRLTSVEIGFGGVWLLAPPQLLFIPDADRDDKPDGPPQVVLDGWNADIVRHNFVNGLRWGPDGWLYGRQGILGLSKVGMPGATLEERTAMDCGIWRYHPVRKKFEVVCQGTTNPWGMDWNRQGELFFINTVIGHLWHALPGAHLQRMFGEGSNPHAFELIPQTADHVHWDAANEAWTSQRKEVTSGTDRAGGGHAHSGMMIYQGGRWPSEYHGDMFTLNLHGRRLNRDSLQRHGATFVGKHRDDFLQVGDPWFRGIDLTYGPDGAVWMIDWSDLGECHENDGVHRGSGRVYRIQWNAAEPATKLGDLCDRTDGQLIDLQANANQWMVRQSRQILQQRHAAGKLHADTVKSLRAAFHGEKKETMRLHYLWCLHGVDALTETDLLPLLDDPIESLRVWGVRLLVEEANAVTPEISRALVQRAERESSGLVLTYVASAMRRLAEEPRGLLAETLISKAALADDPVYPLMVWYGAESLVGRDSNAALRLAARSRIPKLTRFIARRAAGEIETDPRTVDGLMELLLTRRDKDTAGELLTGMMEALQGWRKAAAPKRWSEIQTWSTDQAEPKIIDAVRELSVVFGDGRALAEIAVLAEDKSQSIPTRRQAVETLVAARMEGANVLLKRMLGDRDLAATAVRGLASVQGPSASELLLSRYAGLHASAKPAVIEVLAQRREWAEQLLQSVSEGKIEKSDVSAVVLRQIQLLEDEQLNERVKQLWPSQRLIAADRLKLIQDTRMSLTPEHLRDANISQGKLLFTKTCGNCHKFFGEGGAIGPELTGAQRKEVNYWLENIFDPSAMVPPNYRLSIFLLQDGRVVSGVVLGRTAQTLQLQTTTEIVRVPLDEITETRETKLSLMPDGLLSNLTSEQIRDLIGYLTR